MVVYAICDKFGIISLQTKSKDNVITSSMIMAYASEKRAKEKLELIKKLYDMDEFLSSYSYLNEDDYYATYNAIMEMLKEKHPYMEMEEI